MKQSYGVSSPYSKLCIAAAVQLFSYHLLSYNHHTNSQIFFLIEKGELLQLSSHLGIHALKYVKTESYLLTNHYKRNFKYEFKLITLVKMSQIYNKINLVSVNKYR